VASPRVVECRDCGAPVIPARTPDGRPLRVDAVAAPGGNLALNFSANGGVIADRGSMAQTFANPRNDLHMAHKATCGGRRNSVPPHRFDLDDRIPPDWADRRWCVCGLPGEPGDDRHPVDARPLGAPRPDPSVVEEAGRARDAAILGEREDVRDLIAQDLLDLAERATAEQRGSDTAS
jgi:hypothetical protein